VKTTVGSKCSVSPLADPPHHLDPCFNRFWHLGAAGARVQARGSSGHGSQCGTANPQTPVSKSGLHLRSAVDLSGDRVLQHVVCTALMERHPSMPHYKLQTDERYRLFRVTLRARECCDCNLPCRRDLLPSQLVCEQRDIGHGRDTPENRGGAPDHYFMNDFAMSRCHAPLTVEPNIRAQPSAPHSDFIHSAALPQALSWEEGEAARVRGREKVLAQALEVSCSHPDSPVASSPPRDIGCDRCHIQRARDRGATLETRTQRLARHAVTPWL
jgi:hypothetical protein